MGESNERTAPARRRLSPERRRQQLMDVAYEILDDVGPEGMQISEVAHRAGVSRPLVYRFFSNRTELLVAVLDDFVGALSGRFQELIVSEDIADDPYAVAAMFVHSCCDLIEKRGGGTWNLLMSRSSDREVVAFAETALRRLMEPWYEPLSAFCGQGRTPTKVIADMLIGLGDVALNNWVMGRISRDVAIDACVTSIAGMLMAFANLQSSQNG